MNAAQAIVEDLVKESELVSHCMVYSSGRNYCVALITIDETAVANMCPEQIFGLVEQAVAYANARVSGSEQITRWTILDRDLSAELDEVTPTLKLNRDVVAKHFSRQLDELCS